MSNGDRTNGVPSTVTSIPLVDPHALSADPSIGELVKNATTQVSTLVRAEVELARAERDGDGDPPDDVHDGCPEGDEVRVGPAEARDPEATKSAALVELETQKLRLQAINASTNPR